MKNEEITHKIIGCAYKVFNQLGFGFLEKVYENALLFEIKKQGLKAEKQVPIKVLYKNHLVGEYIADIFVEKKVVVEIKTVENLDKAHEAQLLNYLKATGLQIGLLVNFKHPKAEIKRMVLNLPECHAA